MKITVVGSGAWGTALALLLQENGNQVTLWSHREETTRILRETRVSPMLRDVPLPEGMEFTSDLSAVRGCGMVVLATPSYAVRQTAALLKPLVDPGTILVSVSKGIEKSNKIMMPVFFVIFVVLAVRVALLPGAAEGYRFMFAPDWRKLADPMVWIWAMGQAFFTLSLGIGSIAICGSYMPKENSLIKEGFWIIGLDTTIAICSGLIIFPACAAFNITPDAGPDLIFITLPNVFQSMPGGNIWSAVFFLFLVIAALSTLVAVFENLVAFGMDEFNWKRGKSCTFFGIALAVLSMPCILGYNLWKKFQPFGKDSSVLDLEDFIMSQNLLPLGALVTVLFCTSRWQLFINESNFGNGMKFPEKLYFYCKYILIFLKLKTSVMPDNKL